MMMMMITTPRERGGARLDQSREMGKNKEIDAKKLKHNFFGIEDTNKMTAGYFLSVVVVTMAFLAMFTSASKFELEVASGTHIFQREDNSLEVKHFGEEKTTVIPYEHVELQGKKSSLPQQWLAWYFKSSLSPTSNGFTLFSSVFEVPPVPKKSGSNLAIFNALQASYDPVPYNWILQPVLSTGTWMLGTSKGWTLSSVMCNPNTNKCLFTKPVDTEPGHKILGTIEQISGSLNSYQYRVNITDITAKGPTQSLSFSSQYFAPWAFVSLEHNPEGPVKDCNELPAMADLSFTNNVLQPTSVDMWQGSQNEFACGVFVDTFPYSGDSQLNIHI